MRFARSLYIVILVGQHRHIPTHEIPPRGLNLSRLVALSDFCYNTTMAKDDEIRTPAGDGIDGPAARLQRLEDEVAKLKAPPLLWLEVLKAISPLIAGLAVVWAGYGLTGSVSNALQQKQYQLSNVKEMRDLLLTLQSADTTADVAMANVRTLSAFGPAAIAPLIDLLANRGDTKIEVAQEGLRSIALTEREEVCTRLTTIINNRTRLFTWETHLWTIQLIGELDCREAASALERYRSLLEKSDQAPGFAPYSSTVREFPAITVRSLPLLRQEVNKSITLLNPAEALADSL